jgi:hypothetical protein
MRHAAPRTVLVGLRPAARPVPRDPRACRCL